MNMNEYAGKNMIILIQNLQEFSKQLISACLQENDYFNSACLQEYSKQLNSAGLQEYMQIVEFYRFTRIYANSLILRVYKNIANS